MDHKTTNIIYIKQMINSALQQSSDGTINLSVKEAEELDEFLNESTLEFVKVKAAFVNGKTNAKKLASKYLDELIAEIDSFEIEIFPPNSHESPWGDLIEIEALKMIPLRNKILEYFVLLSEHSEDQELLHEHLTKVLQVNYDEYENFNYGDHWGYACTDHKRILVNEIFLYFTSYLLKNSSFEEFKYLLHNIYQVKCVEGTKSSNPKVTYNSVYFAQFNQWVASINHQTRRRYKGMFEREYPHDLYTSLLESRYIDVNFVTFQDIVECDTLLFYISLLGEITNNSTGIWIPYLAPLHPRKPSDMMLKAVSTTYFRKLYKVFYVQTFDDFFGLLPDLEAKLAGYNQGGVVNNSVHFSAYQVPPPSIALNANNINKQP